MVCKLEVLVVDVAEVVLPVLNLVLPFLECDRRGLGSQRTVFQGIPMLLLRLSSFFVVWKYN